MDGRVSIPLHITKTDDERRLVFGFAKFSEDPDNRGYLMVDRQGDIITPEDLEESAYDYVLTSRDAGEMHVSKGAASLVESVMITPEKLEAWGLEGDAVPIGWWTGYHVHEVEKGQPDPWEKIKKGEYTAFSVEGKAVREPAQVTKASIAKSAEELAAEAEQLTLQSLESWDHQEFFQDIPEDIADDQRSVLKRLFDWAVASDEELEILKHKAPGHPESAHGNRLYSKDANPMGDLMKELKTRFKRVNEEGLKRMMGRFANQGGAAGAKNHDLLVTELARRNIIPVTQLNFKTKEFVDRREAILAAITEESGNV